MSNPVMNYNQFMAAFKKAAAGYNGKANITSDDATGTAKVKQELAEGPVKGKGTPHIDKYTKQYLTSVKKKNVVSGK
jgi:hypothetical protein